MFQQILLSLPSTDMLKRSLRRSAMRYSAAILRRGGYWSGAEYLEAMADGIAPPANSDDPFDDLTVVEAIEDMPTGRAGDAT